MKGLLTYRTIQFSKSRECFHSKSASRLGDKKSPEPVVISNSASELLVNVLSAFTVCASTVNDLIFVFQSFVSLLSLRFEQRPLSYQDA